jgi:hypothetical protein
MQPSLLGLLLAASTAQVTRLCVALAALAGIRATTGKLAVGLGCYKQYKQLAVIQQRENLDRGE